MDAFRFHIPTEIIFGCGKVKVLPNHIKKEHQRLMIFTDQTIHQITSIINQLKSFIKSFGISTNLRDYGVKESECKTFAQKTMLKGDIKITPGKITGDLIKNIYLKSMN